MSFSAPLLEHERVAAAWRALDAQATLARSLTIAELLATEPARTEQLCLQAADLVLDFSRQRLPAQALPCLLELLEATAVDRWRDAMFRGEAVNLTESRAALHTALRAPYDIPLELDGVNVRTGIRDTLARMRELTEALRSGVWRGATGRPISDVVNIGIGGSQLGPQFACEALQHEAHRRLKVHFVGNVDPALWARLSADLNPATTLFVIASKSWRTLETTRNAMAARQWLIDSGIQGAALARHLLAVSSNQAAAIEFGIAPDNVFACPDWVGGRYSLWGAVGLPLMISIGADAFEALLGGAHAMDQHFLHAAPTRNAPVMLALVSVWNASLLGSGTEAVIPYRDDLRKLAAHLQQLQMESNGKSVRIDGRVVDRPSVPVVWGEPGTDSQHSFFQALHQGTRVHPIDFIVVGNAADTDPWQRGRALLANALGQAQALALGHPHEDPHRRHEGNRPSTIIHLPALQPAHLGALIALYEHKTATQAWLWGINPFDQWGVELGKKLAADIEPLLAKTSRHQGSLDPATAATLLRLQPRA